ncbi:hypothetical protein ACOSQ2_009639 [Xanthoceras sorbifolium]
MEMHCRRRIRFYTNLGHREKLMKVQLRWHLCKKRFLNVFHGGQLAIVEPSLSGGGLLASVSKKKWKRMARRVSSDLVLHNANSSLGKQIMYGSVDDLLQPLKKNKHSLVAEEEVVIEILVGQDLGFRRLAFTWCHGRNGNEFIQERCFHYEEYWAGEAAYGAIIKDSWVQGGHVDPLKRTVQVVECVYHKLSDASSSSVHAKSEFSVVDISCWPVAFLEKFRAARVGGERQSPQPSLGRWLPPA